MRGKISDQDLTNYALNDGLEPRERLYIESMLAVSTECRDDIYRGIELGQMLETGFEQRYGCEVPSLTAEQRAHLLNPPTRHFTMAVVHRAAATLAMAACVAFTLANPHLWQVENHRRSLADASKQVSQMVAQTISADAGIAPLVNMPTLSDEVDALMQTGLDAALPQSTMCTPPSLDLSDLTDLR